MDERVMQFRVGVMVLATLIIGGILVLLFGEMPHLLRGGTNSITIVFHDGAPGVSDGTPVRMSGVLIGRVTGRPVLLPKGGVEVTARIDADRPLYPEDVCRISYAALGDAKIEFLLPPGEEIHSPPVSSGARFVGQTAPEPIEMVSHMQEDLKTVIDSVSKTSKDLDQVVLRVNEILGANQSKIGQTINKASDTLDSIKTTMDAAHRFIDDPVLAEKLKLALGDMPKLVQETRHAVGTAEHTFEVASKSLETLDGFTSMLREEGKPMFQRMDHVVDNLSELTGQLNTFSANLNSDRGTVGRLVRSPELYERLDRTLYDVNCLVRDARPIIDNARVFSDKIARHPESLGVRGVLERNPGIK